jgi:hypothetical protein
MYYKNILLAIMCMNAMILSIIQQLQNFIKHAKCIFVSNYCMQMSPELQKWFLGWWNTNRKNIILLHHPMKSKQIQLLPLSQAFLQHNFVNVNTTLWTVKTFIWLVLFWMHDTFNYTTPPKYYYTWKIHFCGKKLHANEPWTAKLASLDDETQIVKT